MRFSGAGSQADRRASGAHALAAALILLSLAGCPVAEDDRGNAKDASKQVFARGPISHYGHAFAGKRTASGAPFDPEALTMAHPTLPFGTRVRVTNLENQRSVEVIVTDRGPHVRPRIGDLSLAAARRIGMVGDGVVEAELRLVAPATRAPP